MCENHIFRTKERGKKMQKGDSYLKNDVKPPFLDG